MITRLINAIKHGTLLISIKARLRIVFRLNNKNIYAEYTRQKTYNKLQKKYKDLIVTGIDEKLPREKSNKIWICWLQGLDSAPDLVKACVESVKRAMPDKEIIVLTADTIQAYIDFPDYIIQKRNQGIIPVAQFTDILRTALLCKYGGGWIDSTVLCTADKVPKYIGNAELFVYRQMDLLHKDITPIELSNWLIFAESNHPILLLTLKLLYAYWKDNNHLTHYFIYHLFFTMAARRYQNEWKKTPIFNNHSPHTLQFELKDNFSEERWNQIVGMSAFHKLNRRVNSSDNEKSFYNYIIKRYLLELDQEKNA